jgi:hypothetical protein
MLLVVEGWLLAAPVVSALWWSQGRLPTSVVSVNVKEGKTQMENHMSGSLQSALVAVSVAHLAFGSVTRPNPVHRQFNERIHSGKKKRTTGIRKGQETHLGRRR